MHQEFPYHTVEGGNLKLRCQIREDDVPAFGEETFSLSLVRGFFNDKKRYNNFYI